MAESIAQFFQENFQSHRHECAYRQRRGYRTESFTYGQVLETAFGLARELETRGIAKGDRVMLWGENSAEWVAAFFGCAVRGVVVVPMDDGSTVDFAMRVVQKVSAKLLIASRRHLQECAGAEPAIASFSLEDLAQIAARQGAAPTNVALARGDVLQIVFTSGTTAEPKGVVITHGNVLANIAPLECEMQGYLKYERLVHPIRFLNLLPLSHVFGQFLGMFLPPLLGGTVIFQEELKPSEVLNTIRRERVSVLVSVPRVLQSLKQKIERDLEDRGESESFRQRLRFSQSQHFLRRWWTFRAIHRQFGWKFWAFISGGAALDSETEEFWGRLGYAVIQGYGLTETTSLISLNHPFRLGKGSIGKVLPGREVKLAEDGEILVRGGGVASGYWDGSRPHSKLSEGDWYHTGDVGAVDAEGNLYFKGRKKDVLITPAGMNVYPEDLEAALRRQPEVRDCVVVGIERAGNTEPCAVVILREAVGGPPKRSLDEAPSGDAGAIVQRANESLSEYQRMREWLVWPENDFPRTSTGKPRVNVIRDVVLAAREERPAAVPGASPLEELISKISGRSAAGLRADAKLEDDLRLSSLERVDLLSALEDRYQVDLSEASFSAARTMGDLEEMLGGKGIRRTEYHYPRWTLSWPVRWIRMAAYYLLIRPAMMLLGWPKIEGRENLAGVKGPVLVVCNQDRKS